MHLRSKGRGLEAHGYMNGEAFIVSKDSEARLVPTPSFESGKFPRLNSAKVKGDSLIADGTLTRAADKDVYIFTEDCEFRSPNEAALVICGASENKSRVWS